MNPERAVLEFDAALKVAHSELRLDPTRSQPTAELSQVLSDETRIEIGLQKELATCWSRISTCEQNLNDPSFRERLVALRTIEKAFITAIETQRDLVSSLNRKKGCFILKILRGEQLNLTQVRNLYVNSDITLRWLHERGEVDPAGVQLFEDCVTLCRERMKLLSSE